MDSSVSDGASEALGRLAASRPTVRGGGHRRLGIALPRILALVAVSAIAALSLAYWIAHRGLESTEDAFVEGTFVYLAPEIPGRVVDVAVVENQPVKQGEVLVRLDPEESEIRVARAEANLAAARNQMVSAEAAAASADAEGKAANVESWRTGRELERASSLASRGAASDQQLDAARAAHDAALATVKALALRAEAERGVLGSEAPVRQAQAELREARLSLARTVLVAPFDAIVGRKNVEQGDIVRVGESLISLTRVEPRWIDANFKETQIEHMRVGQPATVEVDARGGVVFHGHVDSFSPASGAKYALIPPEPAVGNFTKVVQRVPVKIVLDEIEDAEGRRPVAAGDMASELAVGLSAVVTVDVR
jgi:membrane fusion protein (multidrug efflux system)